jgi:integrase
VNAEFVRDLLLRGASGVADGPRHVGDACRWGKLARNPASAADPPSLPRSRATSWSARELRAFLDHVADDRLAALWRVAATTGMRRGEALGLTWRCVDLEGGRLEVVQQLVPTKGGVTFGPPKSRRSERTVALDPGTVDALQRHREAQLLERDLAGPAYVDHDLVFADELGRPISDAMAADAIAAAIVDNRLTTAPVHVAEAVD